MFLHYLTILLIVFHSSISLKIVRQPHDKYSTIDSTIVLNCIVQDYSPETDFIEWCKNGFCTWGRTIEISENRLQFKSLSRYFIVGNRQKGEWNLEIEGIQPSDEGDYKCTVTRRTKKIVKIESNIASVKILRKPLEPTLDKINNLEMIIGKSETIKCLIYDGVPAPTIRWQLSDGTSLTQYSKFSQKFDENLTKVNTYESILNIVPTLDYENKSISCIIEHPTLNNSFEKSINVDLKYAPILSLYYEPNEELLEGKTYDFYCNKKSLPNSNDYSIYLENDEKRILNRHFTIKMDRSLNGKTINCESENSIGKSITNFTLNILYPPKFIEHPNQIQIITKGESLSLKCVVDSNPQSELIWIRNNNELIGFGNDLRLSSVNNSGEYTCQAKNSFFKMIEFSASIIVEGLPVIHGNKNIHLIEKDNDIDIEFVILTSNPYQNEPVCKRLNGLKNLKSMTLSDTTNLVDIPIEKYKLIQVYDKENKHLSSKYVLSLKKLNTNDFGVYSCSISNQYGTNDYYFEVNLKNDSKNLLIITLASILSVLFVLIILLTISIIVCKRRLRHATLNKRKPLPSVIDDISSNTNSSTSPNLSVSDWTKHSSQIHDDHSSQNSTSSQKNLLSEHSLSTNTTDIATISPSLLFVRNDYLPQTSNNIYSNYERYGNMYVKVPNYQNTDNIYSSRLQTNV